MARSPSILHFKGKMPSRFQFGERLRLKIVQGENLGEGFCLLSDNILIGRDDSCSIILIDTQISRQHVELSWAENTYIAKDMDSINGLSVNQRLVESAKLEPGDIMTIGGTTMEVIAPGSQSQVAGIVSPSKVSSSTRAEETEEKELKKKKNVVFLGVIILLVIAFSSGEKILTLRERGKVSFVDEEKPKKKISKQEGLEAIKDVLGVSDTNSPTYKSAEKFYRQGRRELENRNFRRAISAFKTAVTIDQNHRIAQTYLSLANVRLEKEIEISYQAAIRARRSLRTNEAKMHYMRVMGLLKKDPENKLYIDSKEALRIIDKQENQESP